MMLVATKELRPVRLEAKIKSLSGSTTLRGEATEQGLIIESFDGSETHRSTFAWEDDLPLVADMVLPVWLHRQLGDETAIGTPFKMGFLDSSAGGVHKMAFELTARDGLHSD